MRTYTHQLVSKILALLHRRDFVSRSRNTRCHRLKPVLLYSLMAIRFRQIRG